MRLADRQRLRKNEPRHLQIEGDADPMVVVWRMREVRVVAVRVVRVVRVAVRRV